VVARFVDAQLAVRDDDQTPCVDRTDQPAVTNHRAVDWSLDDGTLVH
jgi:hypothetical protein